jgi:hypothetical protein
LQSAGQEVVSDSEIEMVIEEDHKFYKKEISPAFLNEVEEQKKYMSDLYFNRDGNIWVEQIKTEKLV